MKTPAVGVLFIILLGVVRVLLGSFWDSKGTLCKSSYCGLGSAQGSVRISLDAGSGQSGFNRFFFSIQWKFCQNHTVFLDHLQMLLIIDSIFFFEGNSC